MENIAIQLYSLKELTKVDFLGTLKKVSEIGYTGVEFAGYFNTQAKDLKKALSDLSLLSAGSHLGYEELQNNLDALIEYNLEIGSSYIICPWISRDSADEYKKTAADLNSMGAKCKAAGLQFGYHNHAHEFKKYDGKFAMDILVENTEPDNMHVELDTYWVLHAGLNTVDFLKKYGKRCSLIHYKDMADLQTKNDTEVGKGLLDFKEITKVCKELGTLWYIVEQEDYKDAYLQSAEESYRYLKTVL